MLKYKTFFFFLGIDCSNISFCKSVVSLTTGMSVRVASAQTHSQNITLLQLLTAKSTVFKNPKATSSNLLVDKNIQSFKILSEN